MSYIIKPVNIQTGATAPGIVSFSEKRDDAIIDVKSKSRLSAFKNWSFTFDVKHIKDRQVKRFKSEDNE